MLDAVVRTHWTGISGVVLRAVEPSMDKSPSDMSKICIRIVMMITAEKIQFLRIPLKIAVSCLIERALNSLKTCKNTKALKMSE